MKGFRERKYLDRVDYVDSEFEESGSDSDEEYDDSDLSYGSESLSWYPVSTF